MLARCDAIVLLPDWETSRGAKEEVEFANKRGIPSYFLSSLPPSSSYRARQHASFIDVIMKCYRTYRQKSADYSSNGILVPGELGLATRIWDKTCRLLHLLGFRFEVGTSWFERGTSPKNESIDDNLLDLVNYGVIGLILRQGDWGK